MIINIFNAHLLGFVECLSNSCIISIMIILFTYNRSNKVVKDYK